MSVSRSGQDPRLVQTFMGGVQQYLSHIPGNSPQAMEAAAYTGVLALKHYGIYPIEGALQELSVDQIITYFDLNHTQATQLVLALRRQSIRDAMGTLRTNIERGLQAALDLPSYEDMDEVWQRCVDMADQRTLSPAEGQTIHFASVGGQTIPRVLELTSEDNNAGFSLLVIPVSEDTLRIVGFQAESALGEAYTHIAGHPNSHRPHDEADRTDLLDDFNEALALATAILQEQGFTLLPSDPTDFIPEPTQESSLAVEDDVEEADSVLEASSHPSDTPLLDKYSTDLVEGVRTGGVSRIEGRDEEIRQVVTHLSNVEKGSCALVGPAGVGKTAIAIGLAQRMADDQAVSPQLAGFGLRELNVTALYAGTKWRGDAEDRLTKLIKELEGSKTILFIDEVHLIMTSGRTDGMDHLATILKPALARGTVKLLGATTLEEYRRYIEKDKAMVRRMPKVDVDEPDRRQTLAILRSKVQHRLKSEYKLPVPEAALIHIYELTDRFMPNRRFPDKAIEVLVLSMIEAQRTEQPILEVEAIERTIARSAQLPLWLIRPHHGTALDDLSARLASRIFGQPEAVAAVTETMACAMDGLSQGSGPLAKLLFTGDPSSGKTELARALAEELFEGNRPIRLDMSEYNEEHSISRLLGPPPGYRGHGEACEFDRVRNAPFSVVVFDEIEKAHPSVLNLLLQIMEEGCATLSSGNIVNFQNTIVILTTNLVRGGSEPAIGFRGGGAATGRSDQRVRERLVEAGLRAEIIDRLDEALLFNRLGPPEHAQILNRMMGDLSTRFSARYGATLSWNEADLVRLVSSENPSTGRDLKRLFRRRIQAPLSRWIRETMRQTPPCRDAQYQLCFDGSPLSVSSLEQRLAT